MTLAHFQQVKIISSLKPRTGHFRKLAGFEAKAKDMTFEAKAKDFKLCPLELYFCPKAPNTAEKSFLAILSSLTAFLPD